MKDLMNFPEWEKPLLLADDETEEAGATEDKVETLADLATKDETEETTEETTDDTAGDKKERPDWLPEQFFDPESGETRAEALVKSWKDQQDVIKNRVKEIPEDALKEHGLQKIPEGAVTDPADFELVIPEDLKEASERVLVVDEKLGEDPMLHAFRDVAVKHGLSAEAFNDIAGFYIGQSAAVMPAPVNARAELAKLGEHGQAVLDSTVNFGKTLKSQGLLDDDAFQEYVISQNSAAGVKMVQAIRDHYGERPIPMQMQQEAVNAGNAGELRGKQASITKRLRDGDIDDREAQRLSDALDKEYEAHFGTAPASSSLMEER